MSDDTDELYRPALPNIAGRPLPLPNGALLNPADVPFDCEECSDVRWARVMVPARDRKPGRADHWMRPCSQCLPDRYRVMITENHTDHIEKGGCGVCLKYVRPWAVKK